MNTYTFFRTKNENFYLYNSENRYLLNVHPVVEVICQYDRKKIKRESLLKFVLHKFPEMSESEIEFYYKKYEFLKNNNFFNSYNIRKRLGGKISPGLVDAQLINLDNIVFQVTSNCNLNCHYCCFGELYNRTHDEAPVRMPMSFDTAKKFLDYMTPYWNANPNVLDENKIIIGFYGGEPLLNFSLIDKIIFYCKNIKLKNKTKFVFSMTTNAVLLNKYAEFIVKNDFSLLISLDGDEMAHSLRVDKNGRSSFDEVFNNIKKFQQNYPEYFENRVNFNSVLNNRTTVEKVHNFIVKEFNKTPFIETMSSVELDLNQIEKFKQIANAYKDTQAIMELRGNDSPRIKQLGRFFYYNLNNSYKHYSEILYLKKNKQKRIPTGTCLPFHKKLYITADGKIYACERIGMQHLLGHIDTKVNIDLDKISQTYTIYFDAIKKQCVKCYYADSCSECIFQFRFKNNLPDCPHVLTKKQYKYYIGDIFGVLEKNPNFFNDVNQFVTS